MNNKVKFCIAIIIVIVMIIRKSNKLVLVPIASILSAIINNVINP